MNGVVVVADRQSSASLARNNVEIIDDEKPGRVTCDAMYIYLSSWFAASMKEESRVCGSVYTPIESSFALICAIRDSAQSSEDTNEDRTPPDRPAVIRRDNPDKRQRRKSEIPKREGNLCKCCKCARTALPLYILARVENDKAAS